MPNWEFAQISNHYIIGHAQGIFLKFKLKNKYMSLPYLYKERKWIISLFREFWQDLAQKEGIWTRY